MRTFVITVLLLLCGACAAQSPGKAQTPKASSLENSKREAPAITNVPFPVVISGPVTMLPAAAHNWWEEADTWVAIGTGILALFTFLLWHSTYSMSRRQAEEMTKLLELTRQSADAATMSAKAASNQGKLLVDMERASVSFQTSNRGVPIQGGMHQITVQFENHGRSVANVVAFGMECEELPSPPEANNVAQRPIPHGSTISKDGGTWQSHCLIPTPLPQPPQFSTHWYLYGKLTYSDIFGENHDTWFCRRHNGLQFVLDDLDDVRYNGQT